MPFVKYCLKALSLFKADCQQVASTIHAVLAVGPVWNWTTLSSLYPNVSVYTTQLQSLETFTIRQPQDGPVRYLLANHYMADGQGHSVR